MSLSEPLRLGLLSALAFGLAGCPTTVDEASFVASFSQTSFTLGCCEGTGPFDVGTVEVTNQSTASDFTASEGVGLSVDSIVGPLVFEVSVADGPFAPLAPNQRVDLIRDDADVRVLATSCEFAEASFRIVIAEEEVGGFEPGTFLEIQDQTITVAHPCEPEEPAQVPVPEDLLSCFRDRFGIFKSFVEAIAILVDAAGDPAALPPGVLVSFAATSPTEYDFTLRLDPDGDGTRQIVVEGAMVFSAPPGGGLGGGDTATVTWFVGDEPGTGLFGASSRAFVFGLADPDEVTVTGKGTIGTEAVAGCFLDFDIPEELRVTLGPAGVASSVGTIQVRIRVSGGGELVATLTLDADGAIRVTDATLDGVAVPDFTLPA